MVQRNLRHNAPLRLIHPAIRRLVTGSPLEPQPDARALERLPVRAGKEHYEQD